MVRGGDAAQRLHELGHGFPAGLFGVAGREHDKKLIRAPGMRAIKLHVGSDISRLLAETCRGMHHFAGDSVDPARGERLFSLAFATPKKQGNCKEQHDRSG